VLFKSVLSVSLKGFFWNSFSLFFNEAPLGVIEVEFEIGGNFSRETSFSLATFSLAKKS